MAAIAKGKSDARALGHVLSRLPPVDEAKDPIETVG